MTDVDYRIMVVNPAARSVIGLPDKKDITILENGELELFHSSVNGALKRYNPKTELELFNLLAKCVPKEKEQSATDAAIIRLYKILKVVDKSLANELLKQVRDLKEEVDFKTNEVVNTTPLHGGDKSDSKKAKT